MWPEVTDPEKFVYEDVAIATYLLVGVHVLMSLTGSKEVVFTPEVDSIGFL